MGDNMTATFHRKLLGAVEIAVYIFAAIGFIMVAIYIAVASGLTNTSGIIDEQRNFFIDQSQSWKSGQEWVVLQEAIVNDAEDIISAAATAGVNPRMIVALLVVEQLRLFHSNREIFKTVFAPLKILGNQNQFSWGVMGIKRDTAKTIERNLTDPSSLWYLGSEHENLLDFTSEHPDQERFIRLTDKDSRYYSYLYAAILVRQIEKQWSNAGFSISDRPDIIATLYDIGFDRSRPHADPKSGGAKIDIGDTSYSFGSLARIFYESDELITEFPR